MSGYSPIGGAITGPRNSTQNTYEVNEAVTGPRDRIRSNSAGSSATPASTCSRPSRRTRSSCSPARFPRTTPSPICCLAHRSRSTRASATSIAVCATGTGGYAQDEWRVTRRLTFNYGLRYERINPITEINEAERLCAGSAVDGRSHRARGLLFPGDPGIANGIAKSYNAFMPRVGLAWDPTGSGNWSVRSSYGIFFDQFMNGSNGASQVPISSLPAAQFNQFSGQGFNFAGSVQRTHLPGREHLRAAFDGLRSRQGCEAAVLTELELERSALARRQVPGRSALCRHERDAFAAQRGRQSGRVWSGCHGSERGSPAYLRATVRPTGARATFPRSECCATSRTRRMRPARRASRADSLPGSDSMCRTGIRNRSIIFRR